MGVQILRELGVRSMRLLSNNPRKLVGIEGYGLSVSRMAAARDSGVGLHPPVPEDQEGEARATSFRRVLDRSLTPSARLARASTWLCYDKGLR